MTDHNPSNPTYDPRTWPATMDQAGASAAIREICDWLTALGLNPAHHPVDPHATMADGQLTLLRKVRAPGGGDQVLPDRTGIMLETITVPVTVPPPLIVETWLAPRCPTCGR